MMDPSKERTSLKGSKTNVGESIQPLLENPGASDGRSSSPEKERIEIESSIEKDDDGHEKASEQDESERRRPKVQSCLDQFTVHMNLLNRDSFHINDHVNVSFEDILAEPSSNHGFDQVWSLAYMLFSMTKFWVYRVVAAACAVPCGLVWGLLFSLLSILSVWVITPTMKVIEVFLHIVRRVWTGVIHAILDPIFHSASLVFGKGNKTSAMIQETP